MNKFGYIELTISGNKGIIPINRDNYDIKNIISDIQNVENLLFPGDKKNRPPITYNIENGSVKHKFKVGIQYVLGFTAILTQILNSNSIDFLDTNTAKAVESFQKSAINKDLTINLKTSLAESPILKIDKSTNYYRSEAIWVDSEFYFYGKIIDAGGKDKVNIHLVTAEVGTIIIKTPQQTLAELKNNILYKTYGIRAKGKQNIENGEIDKSSLQFLELIDYNSKYEEEYLKGLRKKAMNWLQDINPEEWLSEIRGRNYV